MKMTPIILMTAALTIPTLANASPRGAAQPATHGASAPSPSGPVAGGQPNASCELTPTTPGQSSSAPGSAFNPDGISGTKYAGQQPQNSNNPASVSQYDIACQNQPH